EFGDAWDGGRVELAGLRARTLDEVGQITDAQRCRHADRQHRRGEAGNRQNVVRVVGQLLVEVRVDDEVAARSPQERVIVVGGQPGLDRDDAVTAGPVVDHDRLAPARRQLLLDQAGADIGTGAGPERYDELDRALRPRGCLGQG